MKIPKFIPKPFIFEVVRVPETNWSSVEFWNEMADIATWCCGDIDYYDGSIKIPGPGLTTYLEILPGEYILRTHDGRYMKAQHNHLMAGFDEVGDDVVDDTREYIRVSGNIVCDTCAESYYKHPRVRKYDAFEGQELELVQLCDGRLGKT